MKKTTIIASVAMFAGLAASADEAQNTNGMAAATQSATAVSAPGRFGAGIMVGEPMGVTAKYWLNDTLAVDGSFGFRLRDMDDVYVNADFLWHKLDLIPVSSGRTAGYIGVGPSILFRHEEDNRFGIRMPVGISYMFDNKPIDVFAEFAPILDLSPSVQGDFNVGVGVRYWF